MGVVLIYHIPPHLKFTPLLQFWAQHLSTTERERSLHCPVTREERVLPQRERGVSTEREESPLREREVSTEREE